ncbi:uncharacterized protein METZ01_LOCUS137952 [marine metagenome]|uniref:Uncharacterized protein n=1 Tax=marine metagenome TaxID=408172 RepID=A0A381Z775_9ZZZZ
MAILSLLTTLYPNLDKIRIDSLWAAREHSYQLL